MALNPPALLSVYRNRLAVFDPHVLPRVRSMTLQLHRGILDTKRVRAPAS